MISDAADGLLTRLAATAAGAGGTADFMAGFAYQLPLTLPSTAQGRMSVWLANRAGMPCCAWKLAPPTALHTPKAAGMQRR